MVIPGNLPPNRHTKVLHGHTGISQSAKLPRQDATGLTVTVVTGTKPVDRHRHRHTHARARARSLMLVEALLGS